MSLAAPWALPGLLALPLIWWLHRRLKRPPVLDLPSLMFLQDEQEARALPKGRRLDAELLLALGAAACLVLAAAGLAVERGSVGRDVRVVVANGPPMRAGDVQERLAALLGEIRSALDPDDRLDVVPEPDPHLAIHLRPSPETLLAAARAGPAALRVVISDEAARTDTGDVVWLAVGDSDAANVGIVATRVAGEGEATRVFCNLLNDAAQEAQVRLLLSLRDGSGPSTEFATLDLPARELRSAELVLPEPFASAGSLRLSLASPDGTSWSDDLREDDSVTLTREPLPVLVSPTLPDAHRERIRLALVATLTEAGVRVVDTAADAPLAIVPVGGDDADAGLVLALDPVTDGQATERAPPGQEGFGRHPLVRDLSTSGVDWVYRAGAERPREGEEILLARGPDDAWPVVLRSGRVLRLAPDPLRGEPAAADGPFWPLLIDNLVASVAGGGRRAGAGYRALGVLDVATSRLGRDRIAFDAAVLEEVAPAVAEETRTLRPLLTMAALVLAVLLWAAPWLRRRLGGARAPAPLSQ